MYKVLCLILSLGVITACTKKNERLLSGEAIIDNILYGNGPYYAIGFSFEQGKELATNQSPGPDITVHAITNTAGNITGAYVDTPNMTESFALMGEFDSGDEAKTFFNNLKETGSADWLAFANDIEVDQVWIFKTSEANYVKIRIISVVIEDALSGAFSEVAFEWQIQPDGSIIFTK